MSKEIVILCRCGQVAKWWSGVNNSGMLDGFRKNQDRWLMEGWIIFSFSPWLSEISCGGEKMFNLLTVREHILKLARRWGIGISIVLSIIVLKYRSVIKRNLLDAVCRLAPHLDQLGPVISGQPGEHEHQGEGAAEGDPDQHLSRAPGHQRRPRPRVPAAPRPRVAAIVIRQTPGAPTLAKTESRVPEMIWSWQTLVSNFSKLSAIFNM